MHVIACLQHVLCCSSSPHTYCKCFECHSSLKLVQACHKQNLSSTIANTTCYFILPSCTICNDQANRCALYAVQNRNTTQCDPKASPPKLLRISQGCPVQEGASYGSISSGSCAPRQREALLEKLPACCIPPSQELCCSCPPRVLLYVIPAVIRISLIH